MTKISPDFLEIYGNLFFLEEPLRIQYANFIFNNIGNSDLQLSEIIEQIKREKPIEYIFQKAYFYGYEFYVNGDVLIPRPETEFVVKYSIDILDSSNNIDTIVDVGTGSGCIIISIAHSTINIRKYRYIGIDISRKAIKVMQKNLKYHGLNKSIKVVHKDFHKFRFENLGNVLVCANLPYIPKSRKLPKSVFKYEPHIALFGKGKNGDGLIKDLLGIYLKYPNIKALVTEEDGGIVKYYIR